MAAQIPDTALLTTGTQPRLPSLVSSRRLRAQGLARTLKLWIPAGLLIALFAMCFIWPYIYTLPSSTQGNILAAGAPPFSPGHILGADQVGDDIFSKIVYGGQIAFVIGFSVTAIGLVIGSAIGISAGYLGGWADATLSPVLDIMIAFPALVLVLAVAEVLQPSELHLIFALTAFSIPAFGRISRGATLTVRALPFMTAARLAGTRHWRIIIRHILPNIFPQLVTFALLGIGIVVIIEGAVDYLGLGIQRPEASWGQMIAEGQTVLTAQPEFVLIPSLFLLVMVVSLNLLGDALRERWGVR
jgi:peptide/nickel transport system permease protein